MENVTVPPSPGKCAECAVLRTALRHQVEREHDPIFDGCNFCEKGIALLSPAPALKPGERQVDVNPFPAPEPKHDELCQINDERQPEICTCNHGPHKPGDCTALTIGADEPNFIAGKCCRCGAPKPPAAKEPTT